MGCVMKLCAGFRLTFHRAGGRKIHLATKTNCCEVYIVKRLFSLLTINPNIVLNLNHENLFTEITLKRKTYITLFWTIVALLVSDYAYSQGAYISGRVVNEKSKKPIPFASVSVYYRCGIWYTTKADSMGYYFLKNMRPFQYDIVCSNDKYNSQVLSNLHLLENEVTFIDFNLKKARAVTVIDTVKYMNPLPENRKLIAFDYIPNKANYKDTCSCQMINPKTYGWLTDPDVKINFDSIVERCNRYLVTTIGHCAFCKYIVNTSITSGNKSTRRSFGVRYTFVLPQQFPTYVYGKSSEEEIFIQFSFTQLENGEFQVRLPVNIPDCHETADGGYKINKVQAIALAKSAEFITDHEKYTISNNRLEWIFIRERDSASLKVDMKSGVVTSGESYQRID